MDNNGQALVQHVICTVLLFLALQLLSFLLFHLFINHFMLKINGCNLRQRSDVCFVLLENIVSLGEASSHPLVRIFITDYISSLSLLALSSCFFSLYLSLVCLFLVSSRFMVQLFS